MYLSHCLCVPFESVLTILLHNSGSICSNSYVEVKKETYREPLHLFCILVGHPGTNKSTSIKLAKKSMQKTEEFFNTTLGTDNMELKKKTCLNNSNNL